MVFQNSIKHAYVFNNLVERYDENNYRPKVYLFNEFMFYFFECEEERACNIDRLASKGIVFNKAYCSSLVCRSSREAMDTGLRPNVSGITDNLAGHFRDMPGLKNWVTVPEFFRHNGYEAIAAG